MPPRSMHKFACCSICRDRNVRWHTGHLLVSMAAVPCRSGQWPPLRQAGARRVASFRGRVRQGIELPKAHPVASRARRSRRSRDCRPPQRSGWRAGLRGRRGRCNQRGARFRAGRAIARTPRINSRRAARRAGQPTAAHTRVGPPVLGGQATCRGLRCVCCHAIALGTNENCVRGAAGPCVGSPALSSRCLRGLAGHAGSVHACTLAVAA